MLEDIDWGNFPAYLAALLSFGALLAALYQIRIERRERWKREEQDRENDKWNQAERISAWIDDVGESFSVAVQNGSNASVHNVITTIVSIQGAGPPAEARDSLQFKGYTSVAPPGRSYNVAIRYRGGAMMIRFGVEVAFTDSKGQHWVRDARGLLKNIEQSPVEYYGVPLPIPWDLPLVVRPTMKPI